MAGEQAAERDEMLPPYVSTDEQRKRWQAAGDAARAALGDAGDAEQVWSMQRALYHGDIPT